MRYIRFISLMALAAFAIFAHSVATPVDAAYVEADLSGDVGSVLMAEEAVVFTLSVNAEFTSTAEIAGFPLNITEDMIADMDLLVPISINYDIRVAPDVLAPDYSTRWEMINIMLFKSVLTRKVHYANIMGGTSDLLSPTLPYRV